MLVEIIPGRRIVSEGRNSFFEALYTPSIQKARVNHDYQLKLPGSIDTIKIRAEVAAKVKKRYSRYEDYLSKAVAVAKSRVEHFSKKLANFIQEIEGASGESHEIVYSDEGLPIDAIWREI